MLIRYYEKYNDNTLIYINKPIIKLTRIIIFGTLNQGHINIFNKCKQLADTLIIGVLSDSISRKIGENGLNDQNTRISDIIFIKEFTDLKEDYIKKYNCDILMIEDDSFNKIDWVSYTHRNL